MLHFAKNAQSDGAAILHARSLAILNAHFATQPALDLLDYALSGALGRIALVSSFGAEAAVLLHLVAQIDKNTPVLFIDTQLLFDETLTYQSTLARHLGLRNIHILRARALAASDDLHRRDPDACCALRKTAPLQQALENFDGWITGRKRFQSGTRADLAPVESDPATGKVKLNPLFNWTPAQIADHFDAHSLPRHPLTARGYPSIGCAPCTSPAAPGEDPRAGRWRGLAKLECGIHFPHAPQPARTP